MRRLKNKGQATIEYLFLLIILVSITGKVVGNFGDFLGGSIGNFAHVLSSHLAVGVCNKSCFFNGYVNGANSE
jgi:hypothetical protein